MTDKKILGNWGENLAKDYLLKKGYTYIAQNYKASYTEIDLIFMKDNRYIFIEVKTRTKNQDSETEDPITRRQINNLKSGLVSYCFRNRINLELIRLDLIIILVDQKKRCATLKHYPNIL